MYELIGRIVVGALKSRYERQIKMAAGAGLVLAALGVAAYLAGKSEDEPA